MKSFASILFCSLLLSTHIYAGQGLSDLTTVDNENRDEIIAKVVQAVYASTQDDFNQEIKSFTIALTNIIAKLGDQYSDQGALDFDAHCDKELQNATTRINKISKNSSKDYYDGLKKAGILYGVGVTDPVAQKLQADVNVIENEMINEMRASVAILKSKDTLPAIGQEITSGVNTFQQIAQQEYNAAQAKAMNVPKTTWWNDLKASGVQFMGFFQAGLEKECKIALTDAVNKTIDELGQQASNQAAIYAGYAAESAAQYASYLTDSAMTFGSDVLGKELTATFEKYTSDQLNGMFKTFPDYLKKQGFKAIGVDPNEDNMVEGLKAVIRKQYPVKNTGRFDTLQVRQSTDICPAERNFIQNRMPKITKSLQEHFDITAPLKIALCASGGGGNRAMLVALGFYLGSQDIGLFDSLLYTMGVSGSTWTISGWSYLYATQGMSLTDFKDQLIHGPINKSTVTVSGLSLPVMIDKDQQTIIAENSAQHFAYDQTISTIDLYGGLIGNYSLLPAGKKRLNATWSSIADTIEKGDIPLPIGAAVSYKEGQSNKGNTEYSWFEVGPFEAGSDQVGSYVPTWAFGSKFDKGKPVDGYQGRAPEYPISYYQGVYGSAFAVSMNEVVDQGITNPTFNMLGQKITLPIDTWIKTSFSEAARDTRIYPATFHNYSAGLVKSSIASADEIRLYDGAMNINFPLPLAMRPARGVDAIVICDAAVDLASLKAAQLHFKRHGQKFPDMSNYTQAMLASKPLTILNDPSAKDYDKDMVTILYCPFIKNDAFSKDFDPADCMSKGECNTFNFKYTPEQADRVVELTRYNVNQIKGQIKDVLKALEKQRALK